MKKGRSLSEAVKDCPRVSQRGVWYRSVDGAVFRGFYDAKHPMRRLWGLGAPRGGARFTPKNGPASLYVAEDVDTANREGLQVKLDKPLKPAAGTTRAIYTVEVEINDIIDLRDKAVRALLDTSAAELGGAWRYRKDRKKAPTQVLGGAIAKAGVAGVLFQSTKGVGACLLIFTDNLKRSGSRLEVRDGSVVLERLR